MRIRFKNKDTAETTQPQDDLEYADGGNAKLDEESVSDMAGGRDTDGQHTPPR